LDPSTILVTPIENIIQQVAQAVAKAQLALDKATLQSQKALQKPSDQDQELEELRAVGYQPSWYAIPEATFELKLAFYVEDTSQTQTQKRRLLVATHNASHQNAHSFKSEGTSTLKLRIVPIPPSQFGSAPTGG